MSAPRILLGVSGGIAAYKAAEIVRQLVTAGAEVQVVLTSRGSEFVTPLTLATLSGHPVAHDEFGADPAEKIAHIELAKWADALLVAPATANVIARFAQGLGDDLLSTLRLAFDGPLVVAPAMNPKMWDHAQTRANVAALEAEGAVVVSPDEGFVACGDQGAGRLAAVDTIVSAGLEAARCSKLLSGQHVVVSAGPTFEAVDPVRFVGNRSSGKMGYALARAARARGAEVVLVSGPTCLPPPFGLRRILIESAEEMKRELFSASSGADIIIMAAAVADHRPVHPSGEKLKPDKNASYTLEMRPNPDILAELCAARAAGSLQAKTLIVGFAAETGDAVVKGAAKRRRKGCDLLIANDVTVAGAGFGSDTNIVTIISDQGERSLPLMSKRRVAEEILDAIARMALTR